MQTEVKPRAQNETLSASGQTPARQQLPSHLKTLFELVLTGAHPGPVVLSGNAHAGVAEQERDLIVFSLSAEALWGILGGPAGQNRGKPA
jgi:hypothetical protein